MSEAPYQVPAAESDACTDYHFAATKGEAEVYENVSCCVPTQNVISQQGQSESTQPNTTFQVERLQSGPAQPKTTWPSAINFKITLILILIALSLIVNLILAACGLALSIQNGGKVDQVQRRSETYYTLIKSLVADDVIRLVGGTGASGRVEILHDGVWGTICDDNLDNDAGDVMCRMLGFSNVESMQCCAAYGQGSGKIWLDDLRCSGNEKDLEDCNHRGWGVEDCDHNEDLSITCE